MNFLLEKKQEHERACELAIQGNRSTEAVFHAAKAAEFAFALAERAADGIAQRYIEDAEGWLEIAERLRAAPLPRLGSSPSRAARRTSDEADVLAADDWLVASRPSVSFDQIAGMADAKQAIFEMVVYPLREPEAARSLGLKPGGGLLLYGPPGNGKTMLGKAVAHELDAPFYYASGAQIRSKWHGESEQKLRLFLRTAKEQPVAVVFLDEVDGLLPRRGGSSVVDNRIVTQFLAEIGGFEESDNVLLILGATNKPWEIDEAVFRTGRFDQKIYVGLPDAEARRGILQMHLQGTAVEPGFSINDWVDRFDGYAGSDIVAIVNGAKRRALARTARDRTPPILCSADIEAAMATMPRSVTPRMLKEYENFARQRF